jgi:pimeloyl-ACP methyl ester carboxylesterase
LFPLLEESFSVITIDRRGRGESGDASHYTIEREFEDILAVVNAVGENVNLLGHSFGGILALEAARLARNVRRLVIYEGVPIPREMFPAEMIDRLQTLLAAGKREDVLIKHYRDNVGMGEHEISQLRESPAWSERIAAAHTVPRELKAFAHYNFDAQRFKDFQTPTLLLRGSDSPPFIKNATETVNQALSNCQIGVLSGQQHIAMYTAPKLLFNAVVQFLIAET